MDVVTDMLPPTSYVSRVVALPPGIAGQVFDAFLADRQHHAALELHGPGTTGTPDLTRSWAMRTVPGELRVAPLGGAFAVALELNPWSGGRTEVGVRLVGRRRPTTRYLAAAGAVVDGLCS